jgi:penicillin-insensitive murein endopeptidase
MRALRRAAIAALLLVAAAAERPAAARDGVAAVPYPGPARSIGSAANGCLAGAEALPLSGPGWETLRPERNRFWGNPALVAFLEDMAGKTRPLGRLLIADMAQPRGGHMVSGHGSHQTGLDVDILYTLSDHPLTKEERSLPAMDSILAADGTLSAWTVKQTTLVRTFAENALVERIFVNPAIKRMLCQTVRGDRTWLTRIRPWWGHADHFHVRLSCPSGDHECRPGPPIPAGDGCGAELDWWFTPEAAQPRPASGPPPVMPAACKAILQ